VPKMKMVRASCSAVRCRHSVFGIFLSLLAGSLASCGGGGGSGGSRPEAPPAGATVTTVHNFRPDLGDGGQPNGPLLQASDGNLYGTARSGGVNRCRSDGIPCGVVFKISTTGMQSVLYHFGSAPNDGYTPSGPLIQGRDGALYGLTSNGGDYGGGGVVFRITLDGTYAVLHSFGATQNDGISPVGGLVEADDGNFYGVTASGGANHCPQIPQAGGNCGTVFRTTPQGATSILYSFGASAADGVTPLASLVQASDGHLYGTTASGGAYSCSNSNEPHTCGTAFRTTLGGEATVLHSFGRSLADGVAPQGALVQAADGALYGTTVSGGAGSCGGLFGCGTVFKMTLAGQLSIVHAFAVTSREGGYGPAPYLVRARDGNFYGMTGSGGVHLGDLNGTVFKLTPAGVLATLYSFGPTNSEPSNPYGGLVEAADGTLYGVTTYSSAAAGGGTVFKLTRP
jgi:uncharacterized repeat protein (TIGR03803 family)